VVYGTPLANVNYSKYQSLAPSVNWGFRPGPGAVKSERMSKPAQAMFEVNCPCCEAALKIDPAVRAVISHQAKERPKTIGDLSAADSRLKAEAERREQAYQKSVEEQKSHQQVLAKKFDELLKQAKANPDAPRPLRDIDLD